MDRQVLVHVDLRGVPVLAGRLWSRVRRGRESATFEYDNAWLDHPERFALEPALFLGPGPQHTSADTSLFGAIGDSAPDRWGRVLMRRAEARRARAEGRAMRTLFEIDYLMMVDDEARQGALRYKERADGPFLSTPEGTRIPPLVELRRLLSAADRVLDGTESDADLRLLLAPGSSLGGARPKASVRDRDGRLSIAKFPARQDETNVVLWEAVALTLAAKAGIEVPSWRLEFVGDRRVLLARRFDRTATHRIPFLSAMSMLGAKDNETRSYLEIADSLRQHGAKAADDLKALWRRVVFSVLISNADDHLRNHGFLYAPDAGWRLSPAYDLNPVPIDIKPRVLSTAIDARDTTASLGLALEVAGYFGLAAGDARDVARQVARPVKAWRRVAASLGATAVEIDRMSSAFEHEDLAAALK